MTKITIHNVETGQIVERDLNTKELADLKEREAQDVINMQKRADEIASRNAIIQRLGLTPEEAASLLA